MSRNLQSGIKLNSSESERQMVEEYLNGASSNMLAKKYGYATRKSVTDKVKKYIGNDFDFRKHIQSQKSYSLDLSNINSEFNAYFIGLMLTDGYVQDDNRHFGIDLADEDCIKFLSESTGQKYNTYKSSVGNLDRHRIIFSSKENVEQLKRYGIVNRKSLTLDGFDIKAEEEQFIPYLIRGIIDGDGTIHLTSYGELYVGICSGSKKFIEWLQNILKNKLYLFNLDEIYQREDTFFYFGTALKRNIDIIRILCYDKPFGMSRKYNIINNNNDKASETIMIGSNK